VPAIRFWLILIALLWLGSLAAASLYFVSGLRSSTTPPSYFTTEQVREGSVAYAQHCASCHGAALEGANAPALIGETFWNSWGGKTVATLYEYNSHWMPQGRGGSLSLSAYETTTAYMLAENGLPSGKYALEADEGARLNSLLINRSVSSNRNRRDNATQTTVRSNDLSAIDAATNDTNALSSLQNDSSPGVSSTSAPSSGDTLTSAELYTQNCARCHGDDGAGGIGPSLVNNPRLEDAAWTVGRIAMGGLGMPAYAYLLGNEQIADITSYIRNNFENTYGDVTIEEVASVVEQLPPTDLQPVVANLETSSLGQQRYTQLCTACHGLQGGGGVGPPLAGNDDVGDERNVITILLYGRGRMPGFAQYGDKTIAEISSYIRTQWGNSYSTVNEAQVQTYRTTSSSGVSESLVQQGTPPQSATATPQNFQPLSPSNPGQTPPSSQQSSSSQTERNSETAPTKDQETDQGQASSQEVEEQQ
jgi:mono/diheme cytochrome c family protein